MLYLVVAKAEPRSVTILFLKLIEQIGRPGTPQVPYSFNEILMPMVDLSLTIVFCELPQLRYEPARPGSAPPEVIQAPYREIRESGIARQTG